MTKEKAGRLAPVKYQDYGKLFIKASARAVAVVQNFVSREETRHYLTGVHFEKHPAGGVVIVATCGTALAAYYDPDGIMRNEEQAGNKPSDHIILPITAGLRGTLTSVKHCTFIHHDKISHVVNDDHSETDPRVITKQHIIRQYNEPICWNFPEWRRVVPKSTSSIGNIGIDLNILRRFKDALGGKACHINIAFTGQSGACLVRKLDEPFFLGVVMPCQHAMTEYLPAWYEKK